MSSIKLNKKCEIHLSYNGTNILLPIAPASFEIKESQDNETATAHNFGEINLIGKRKLKEVTIDSFFPARQYGFAVAEYAGDPLSAYVRRLSSWMAAGNVITFLAVGTGIAWHATIESFIWGKSDTTGDINYQLALKEYRKPTGRVARKVTTKKHICKKGDTLKKLAKKYLGKTSYSNNLYKANKAAITAGVKKAARAKWKKYVRDYNKKHRKKIKFSSKSVQKKYKADLKRNKKKLYKGVVLYISKVVTS